MLKKFRPGWDFLLPLTAHCLVHATFTFAIVWFYNKSLLHLALIDFCVHFIMDRIKAGPRYLGRWSDMTKAPFWITFGIDQMVHHLTHYYIIWVLVTTPPLP